MNRPQLSLTLAGAILIAGCSKPAPEASTAPTTPKPAPVASTDPAVVGFMGNIGKPAPQFVMTSTTGKKITNETLKGKVVLIDYWATWCGPCKAASPVVQQVFKDLGPKGLVVIGADVMEDNPEDPKPAVTYKKSHNFTYTFTYNNNGLAKTLNIASIPAFTIIDRKGVIQEAIVGLPREGGPQAMYDWFIAHLEPLLSQHA